MFVKSVWMHRGDLGSSLKDIERVFSNLSKHGFSKVFLFVKGEDSDVIYPTELPDARFVMADWRDGDPLEKTIKVAHSMGIEVHATFVIFCEGHWRGWGIPSEPGWWLSQNLGFVQVDRGGREIFRWADPSKRGVREHEKNIILEVVRKYEVDGIQLDYIRYPEEAEGCFCDHCRSEFMRIHQIDPKNIIRPDKSLSLWVRWKAENITSFVRELRYEMRQINPSIMLSAAVFKDYPRCLITVSQDWPRWIEEGIVDFLCPMTYEYDLKVARYLARNHRAAVGANAILYEGLGKASSQSILSPQEVRAQAEVFKEEGANGITVFSLSSLTEEDFAELDKIS
ncbi:MAG: family 10 glycosylhydrolase [Candidatus Bathyarchaeia archaeon]|nr:family 10 glycosylhydrolase [Candidatus Bathyarchaeota archaeon]